MPMEKPRPVGDTNFVLDGGALLPEFPDNGIRHMKRYASSTASMLNDIMAIFQWCLMGILLVPEQKMLFIDEDLVAKSGHQWI